MKLKFFKIICFNKASKNLVISDKIVFVRKSHITYDLCFEKMSPFVKFHFSPICQILLFSNFTFLGANRQAWNIYTCIHFFMYTTGYWKVLSLAHFRKNLDFSNCFFLEYKKNVRHNQFKYLILNLYKICFTKLSKYSINVKNKSI